MNARARFAFLVLSLIAPATALLILPSPGYAQHVGISAGANFASLTPEEDESPDISRRLGLVGGVWIRTAPARRVSLQVEGLFSEKGVQFDASGLGISGVADVRIRYMELPLLAHISLGAPTSTARLFAVGGVAPAFRISGRATVEGGGDGATRDITDDLESVDAGLIGGIGVEFGRTLVEVRYTHGLRRTNKDHNDPNDSVQNRVFSVTAGFRFR